ncbi:ribosomal RNA processing protein [Gracilaria domingensis]|nr:ribosomal RNA processing protein [Gracilaria domingensis]
MGARTTSASHFALKKFSRSRPELAPKSIGGRGKKSRPREISSRMPVPVGRERCLGIDKGTQESRTVRKFDPRFEEHCGDLLEHHVERNYAFVRSLRKSEKKTVQERLKKNPEDYEASHELKSMEQDEVRRNALLRRRDILDAYKKDEKEAVKRGKQPYFLKEKDVRNLEMKARFEELKKKGGIKKYIQKRRKRLASKDKKLLPKRRPFSNSGSDS